MSTLITIEKLHKAHGPHVIFEGASLSVHEKQKVGVIGRNGAGKSTLLRMITGEEEWDSGELVVHTNAQVGYLRQHDDWQPGETVIAFLERVTGKEEWRCAKVAGAFDIKGETLLRPVAELSGGFQMRVKLSVMLLLEPNIFLLDEPTNYLDVETQLLLERFLQTYSGAFLIVSHDREFLERTCTETLEVERGKLTLYPGTVSSFLQYKEEQMLYAERFNKRVEREKKRLQEFVDRFRYKASKASQAQSKMKVIERLQTIEVAKPLPNVRMFIPDIAPRKGLLLRTKMLAIGYGERVVADKIAIDIDRGEKVAIVGNNGQGKTTLLKTLVGELESCDGTYTWAHDVKIAYYAQHVPESLNRAEKAWGYLRRVANPDVNDEEVLRMAGNFLFDNDGLEKPIGVLSGGERSRLCLAGLLLTRSNVLIFDEPTNHLDFETVEAFSEALAEYNGSVLFVSHNRTFVQTVATVVVEVKNGEVRKYRGSYDDYIYYLKQQLAGTVSGQLSSGGVSAPAKKIDREREKEVKRAIRKLEERIMVLERDKEKLEKKQAKNPLGFSAEHYRELGEYTSELAQCEEEWFRLQEELRAGQGTSVSSE